MPIATSIWCQTMLPASLKPFGEIGVVTTKNDIQGKLLNQGTHCMLVGYSVNHTNDVYCMLNLDTKSFNISQDVVWLKQNHKDWSEKKNPVINHTNHDDNELLIPHILNPIQENQEN